MSLTPIHQVIEEMLIDSPELAPILKPREPDDEFRYFMFASGGVLGIARGQSDQLAELLLRMGVVEINRPSSFL